MMTSELQLAIRLHLILSKKN